MNQNRIRQYLTEFNFKRLFTEELGWDRHDGKLSVQLDALTYDLHAVAQKRGVQIFECTTLPDYKTRRKIDHQVARSAFEHLIIFSDRVNGEQIWQWVARETGKAAAYREYPIRKGQSGDTIIQKLQAITFPLDEEEALTLTLAVRRLKDAFDKDRVTKRFYDLFKKEHDSFLKFIEGIPDEGMERWYASVMINRLMFIYFIQKKGFLNQDLNYLQTRLKESKHRGKDQFYKSFLCPLFFDGFAKKEEERSRRVKELLGKIPYLNGGLFLKHQIEELHGREIIIPDKAFDKLFAFFDDYEWHLDDRPIAKGNEINPDVLGYIFEKYINQKELGAYYTKEDITGYISKSTIIPHLFDVGRKECKIAFEGPHSVWRLLQNDPDRYIYGPVRRGVVLDDGSILPESKLPDFVQSGMHDAKERMFDRRYNLEEAQLFDHQGKKLSLPTETWREYVERRKRCIILRENLKAGEIEDINDLITFNLNISQFAQDVIDNCEGPDLLNAFWKAINKVTILDPTCGSGAFLFAALNILEPLYEACLQRMEAFINEWGAEGKKKHPNYFKFFTETLERVEQHPNIKYFIYKSIIVNNLFGVDILEEAVEICKLRLFLKLVAQMETAQKIEALPDIDFNIRPGNTLIGYATHDDVRRAVMSKLDFDDAMEKIEKKAQDVDRLFELFRRQQTELEGEVRLEDKQELRKRLRGLENELNRYLAKEYRIEQENLAGYQNWVNSHKPIHWFIEFYRIMKNGGFDVIIGNPPYVDYTKRNRTSGKSVKDQYKIAGYVTEPCNNLFAFVLERCYRLQHANARFGMIIPVSSISSETFKELAQISFNAKFWVSSYSNRPGKLFKGVEQRLVILIRSYQQGQGFTTQYQHWYEEERNTLLVRIGYTPTIMISTLNMPFKIGGDLDRSIVSKIYSCSGSLRNLENPSKYSTWFHDGPTYWIRALPFQPEMNQTERSNHYHRISSQTSDVALSICAILNSSTFYYHFKCMSNCRDFGNKELHSFPIGTISGPLIESLASLAAQLGDRLNRTSQLCFRVYPSGKVSYKEYYPQKAKDIINQIDIQLAKHYALSEEEADRIINLSIKYRMSRDIHDED